MNSSQEIIIIPSDDESSSEGRRNTSVVSTQSRKRARSVNPAKTWCFTYNNADVQLVDQMASDDRVQKFSAQQEVGAGGTEHVQGVLVFQEKQRPMSVFPELKEIHWELCRNYIASVQYCQKEETRKSGGKTWSVGAEVPTTISVIDPKGWQLTLLERIPRLEDRKIYWYHEPRGGIGKSMLMKYLVVKQKALVLSGKGADMKYAITIMKEKPKLIIIDVPRSSHQYISYSGIEEVSNGCFFSPKYEAGMCVFESPKIIVFANEVPDFTKMSEDRWNLTDLSKEKHPRDC